MAKMGGCNYEFNSASSPQGTSRIKPASFARNSLSKGGVNKHGANGPERDKPAVKAGSASQGKYHHMPKSEG